MIENYLNQKCLWEARQGITGNGVLVYDLPVELACRWQGYSRQFLHPATGEVIMTSAQVYLAVPVNVGDRLTYKGQAREILQVFDLTGLDGETLYYKVIV